MSDVHCLGLAQGGQRPAPHSKLLSPALAVLTVSRGRFVCCCLSGAGSRLRTSALAATVLQDSHLGMRVPLS